jgi:hypothetical protein
VADTRTGEKRTSEAPTLFSFICAVPRTDWPVASAVGEGAMAVQFVQEYFRDM